MGKAHIHPHFSSGFSRATRVAEGFHSDFRGPFSCQTPSGHMYLLTIIDDFSRRIFAFIWSKFDSQDDRSMLAPFLKQEAGLAQVFLWNSASRKKNLCRQSSGTRKEQKIRAAGVEPEISIASSYSLPLYQLSFPRFVSDVVKEENLLFLIDDVEFWLAEKTRIALD